MRRSRALHLWLVLALVATTLPTFVLPSNTVIAQTDALPFDQPLFLPGVTRRVAGSAVGDLDGNGTLDLVIHNAESEGSFPGTQILLNNGAGQFRAPVELANSNDDTDTVVLGDIDNDGALDLINGGGRLYRNNGAGNFSAPIVLADRGPVALGDLNGDGKLDLVAICSSRCNLSNSMFDVGVLINTGNATFAAPAILPDSRGATTSVAMGDIDDDGDLDIVLGTIGSNNLLYRNDGAGNFPLRELLPGSTFVTQLVLADMNGDNALDVVYSSFNNPSQILLNNGTGGFPANSIVTLLESDNYLVAVGDLDGDGDFDVIVNGGSEGLRVYLNNGNATFSQRELIDLADTLQLADFDEDGALDLMVASFNSAPRLYLNNGAGGLLAPAPLCVPEEECLVGPMAPGDYNGDGATDVLLGTPNIYTSSQLWLNDGAGGFLAAEELPFGNLVQDIATGDFDGDGDLDAVLGAGDQLSPDEASWLYLNQGGSFGTPELLNLEGYAEDLASGDFDGDGDLDLAVAQGGYSESFCDGAGCTCPSYRQIPVVVLFNDSNANFTSQIALPNTACTSSVAVGDLNGDGTLDLVVAKDLYPSDPRQGPQAFLNNGTGGFNQPITLPVSNGEDILDIALGDLDGDGVLDLVVADFFAPALIFPGKGDGSFELPRTAGAIADTDQLALADINLDGALDILGRLRLLNDGNGNFRRAPGVGLPADIDGNGIPDLVQGNTFTRSGWGNEPRMPNSPPTVRIARPGNSADAPGYSSAEILSASVVDIPYSLSDREGEPVNAIRAEYSLDGGGSWQPAIAASGTITRNLSTGSVHTPEQHLYRWDTFASGVFGQSDNVVFRIVALNGGVGRNTVATNQQRPYAAATSPPFRVRGTQVQVLENGQPQPDALVYRLPAGQSLNGAPIGVGNTPFTTDGNGYLRGRGALQPGDQLLALAPISRTATYTLYATNGTPTELGVNAFGVSSEGVQTLNVSSDKPLILFDLDVSLEWDASNSASYLQQLQFDVQRASQYLYDFSNGQVALGSVRVHQNADDWAYSEVVVHATNRLRPFAVQGGIVLTRTVDPQLPDVVYDTGQIHMGASWNRYGTPGQNLGEDWPIILAHELSHYLLFQDDSYLGINEQGFLVAVGSCRGSAMGDLYTDATNSEFIADESYWQANCANTLPEQTLGRNEWETLKLWYPQLNAPTTLNPGPATMPFNFTTVMVNAPLTPTLALQDPTFYLDYVGGVVSSGEARAYLLRENKYVFDLGSPNGGQNRLLANGAQPGDRVCVFDRARQQYGCETVALGDDRIVLEQDASWKPVIRLTPVTSRTFTLAVEGLPQGLNLQARLFPEYGEGSLPISLLPQGAGYGGEIVLSDPALTGNLQLWVAEPSSEQNPRRETIVGYAIGGNPGTLRGGGGTLRGGGGTLRGGGGTLRGGGGTLRGGGAPLLSPDGQMIFFTPNPIVFQEGNFYTIQDMAGLPTLPAGKTVIGRGYSLIATPGTPIITGSVSFQYLGNEALVAGADEDQLTIHYWDEAGQVWRALPTVRDSYFNLASAQSQGAGIYALLAGVTVPQIAAISPTRATNDAQRTLTISGSGFLPPAQVTLRSSASDYQLPVTSVVSTSITAVITAGLEARAYEVIVTNGDGGTATAPTPLALYTPNDARFYDFFESGSGQWQREGEWSIALLPDGNRAITDSPAGNYRSAIAPAAQRVTSITSQPFSLEGLNNPTLHFRHDYALARLGSSQDVARVEISSDGGASWQALASYTGGGIYGGRAAAIEPVATEWGDAQWKQAALSLRGYSGTVQLRFSLQVDQNAADRGWVIDDVLVRTGEGNRVLLPLVAR